MLAFSIYSTLFAVCNAQVTQQWVARYNYYADDAAQAIAVDDAGNVYVTGWSDAYTFYGAKPDYATIKYNSAGVQQWVQRYNGPGNDLDEATGIALDDSGNVYVTGRSNSGGFPGLDNYDIATIKYNTNGVQQWVRRYDGGGNDLATAGIELDAQGNIYVGGGTEGIGYIVIKYNSNGDSLWVRTFNSGGNYAAAMAVDASGNVYLTGAMVSTQLWATVKWNSQGVFQWVQYGPPNYPKAIAVDDSGNVYVTGYTFRNNHSEYTTVKYNLSGVQQWVAYYGGLYGGGAVAIIVDDTSNVYVTGAITTGTMTTTDYLTIKYNSIGAQQWIAEFNGPANSYDIPYSIKLDAQGNVYVTGYSTVSTNNTDYCTIKYNNTGVQQWVMYYDGFQNPSPDVADALAVDHLGNVYVTGLSWGYGNKDYATVKYSQTTGIKQISNKIPREFKLEQNYPNPFNSSTKFKFQSTKLDYVEVIVYDVLGGVVARLVDGELKPGTYEVDFNATNYSSGVYYYRLIARNYSDTRKMVLLK